MADLGPYREKIASIRDEWDRAEEYIKLAEQVCENVVFPSIKELRYCGRRIVEALHGIEAELPEESIDALIQDALFDCHRARHDAIDAATSKIAIDLEIATRKIGYKTVLATFPEFPELFRQVTTVRTKIVESRKDRGNRESIYSTIVSTDFKELVALYNKFRESEILMVKYAKEDRKEKLILYSLAIGGIIAGIIGIIV